jgi:uncharacterized protein YjbI with pentapeptide repeats
MPKGRAALLQGIRWTIGGFAAVVLAAAVAWALFVPVADSLAHHDVGSVKGSLHETALDNARSRLLTLGAGLFAAGALVFTARNFALSRQGQVTDRYTKAIEQLGSKELDVRIGGIYALERVASDSARDHPTVMEVLTAFIREHSYEQWSPSGLGGEERGRSTRPDVQAALTVVGRRDAHRDTREIDLFRANLAGAHLTDADLARAHLAYANLARAILLDANLAGANLSSAKLTALLTGADLTRASLVGADLTVADLLGANLTGVNLFSANLTRANLAGADLTGADLLRANLTGSFLAGVDLTRARNLTGSIIAGADLTLARWPAGEAVPEGWRLDPALAD